MIPYDENQESVEPVTKPTAAETYLAAHAAETDPQERIILTLEYQKDNAYRERDRCVAALGKAAIALGGRCWLARHEDDPDWDPEWMNIVFIQFPEQQQMSWHIADHELPQFEGWTERDVEPYDGHSTQEKYKRLEALNAEKLRFKSHKGYLNLPTIMSWLRWVAKKQNLCVWCFGSGDMSDERNPIGVSFRAPCKKCNASGRRTPEAK